MIDTEYSVLINPSKRNQQFCDKVDLPSSYDECRIIMLIMLDQQMCKHSQS